MSKILTVLFLTASLAPLVAQDFVAPVRQPRQIEVTPTEVTQKPSIEGIVKQVFVTGKPWQVVNPAAPASYGSGVKNVSKDFGPATPFHSTGLVVVGVEW